MSATYTSFISEELFSRLTRLSTLPGSGLKQGWSGFRVLPSSGIHVCSQVSKKGVSPEGLGSDRITWKGETGAAMYCVNQLRFNLPKWQTSNRSTSGDAAENVGSLLRSALGTSCGLTLKEQADLPCNPLRILHPWTSLYLFLTSLNCHELTSEPYVCTTWQSMRKEMSKSRARTDADLAEGQEGKILNVSISLNVNLMSERNSHIGTCHSCIWTHILRRWCAWETHWA